MVGTSEGNLLYFSDESPCLMKTVKLEINEDDLQTILDAERRGYVINRNKKILFLKKIGSLFLVGTIRHFGSAKAEIHCFDYDRLLWSRQSVMWKRLHVWDFLFFMT